MHVTFSVQKNSKTQGKCEKAIWKLRRNGSAIIYSNLIYRLYQSNKEVRIAQKLCTEFNGLFILFLQCKLPKAWQHDVKFWKI